MADDPDEPDNGINTPVNLAAIDVVLIAAYFLMVGVVGLAFWIKERRSASAPGGGSSEEFFLAGRSMGWPAIGLSLFVSNIGSEHLVGLAGSAGNPTPLHRKWGTPTRRNGYRPQEGGPKPSDRRCEPASRTQQQQLCLCCVASRCLGSKL